MTYVKTNLKKAALKTVENPRINASATVVHILKNLGRRGATFPELRVLLLAEGVSITKGGLHTVIGQLAGKAPVIRKGKVVRNDTLVCKTLKKDGGLCRYFFNPKGTVRVRGGLKYVSSQPKVTRVVFVTPHKVRKTTSVRRMMR